MTQRPPVNVAQSVHQKLLTRAKVDDDGMRYDPGSLTTEAITLEADYRGWRIRFRASLGNARVAMQVDLGTFERRKTKLPASAPTAFTPEFFEDRTKQIQWRAFLSKGLATREEVPLAQVTNVIWGFLMPPTEAIASLSIRGGRKEDLGSHFEFSATQTLATRVYLRSFSSADTASANPWSAALRYQMAACRSSRVTPRPCSYIRPR